MVKTRLKPATKAGKREIFGKVVMVKAKPAKTIVKAYLVSAFKKAVYAVLRPAVCSLQCSACSLREGAHRQQVFFLDRSWATR
mmetsp:Transcript_74928/g.242269  ORF Transcript_74928/g.242269 Transcript_74928/m.242269 type:complete len:83 (-) Transcript_74928:67-315(-)